MKQKFINEEVKTELFDLISSVGGFLGLFLGISCLGLEETVEILLKILIFIIKSNIVSKISDINN